MNRRTATALILCLGLPAMASAERVGADFAPDPKGDYTYEPPEVTEVAEDGVYHIEIRDLDGVLHARVRNTEPELGEGHLTDHYDLFHLSGELKQRVPVNENGDPHGEALTWDTEGRRAAVTPYRHGHRHGTEVWYWDTGDVRLRKGWKEGTLHGPWQEFYRNGQIELEETYVDGRLEGVQRKFHKDGQLASVSHWSAGERDGIYRNFDAEGRVLQEGRYLAGNLDGTVREYWPSGELRKERTLERGTPVSPEKQWSEDGELVRQVDFTDEGAFRRERRWRDGALIWLREAVTIEGYDPGFKTVEIAGDTVETEIKAGAYYLFTRERGDALTDRTEMIDGDYTGLFVATGTIDGEVTRVTFVDGKEHGLFTKVWQGETLDKGRYEHGHRVGDWVRTESYGRVIHESYDEAGELHGERRYVTRCCDDLLLLETYDHGTLDGPYKEMKEGELVTGGTYVDGQKSGHWQETVNYGSEVWTGTCEADRRTGTWTRVDSDGYRLEVADFAAGERDGPTYLFAEDGAVRTVQMWRHGQRHGYSSYYGDDGTVQHDLWRDGQPVAPDAPSSEGAVSP
ncbi:hypothetical protein [Salipiger sp.]|uniref:hypothetical protein n=1 Tax=Salipiger sp. TaxID=2078585 RepID=UPI003A97EB75